LNTTSSRFSRRSAFTDRSESFPRGSRASILDSHYPIQEFQRKDLMKFDAGMEAFIAKSEKAFPPDYRDYSLEEQREMYRALCRAFKRPHPPGLAVEDRTVPAGGHAVPVRTYRPKAAPSPQPCLLYMHGGGWILGDLESHDGVCAEIAAAAGVAVVSADYRLAPEHRFPAQVEDCGAVLDHLARQAADFGIDPGRLGVGGDSAGGNLAAALCLRSRDRGGPAIKAQILIYPELGLGMTEDGRSSAGDAPLLAEDEMDYYAMAYLGTSGRTTEPYAAPLLAGDFKGLPPAFVQAVEYDPLRADAETYAARLEADGVSVELEVAPGLVHGALRARFVSAQAGRAFERLCAAVRRLVAV
jgi:acetyl esterase